MNTPIVDITYKDYIAEIRFFNPAGNSLNSEQLSSLTDKILEAGNNKAVKVVHLKSEGERAFCGGASFQELLAIDNLEEGEHFFMGFANVINAIRTCEKIVVTSVQGKAVGGGVGIAAASDYVLATESASVKLSELSIGIGPFVIEPAVSRKIGLTSMSALTLNPNEWKSALWAEQVGLYQQVLPSSETLQEASEVYLRTFKDYNPVALLEMKKVLWQGTKDWSDVLKERAKISGKLVLSDETKKALARFRK